jgi:hypothetical protein
MLTIEQVRKEATTPKKALEISIKHWWENYRLEKEEKLNLDIHPCAEGLCGLCVFYISHCDECPIEISCANYGTLYNLAGRAYKKFKKNESEENYQAWRKAAKAMHKYLVSLRSTAQQSS